MERKIIVLILLLFFSVPSHAEIYFSDDFEISGSSWDGRTDSINLIDSEAGTGGYGWETIWPNSQTATRHGEISSSYGYSGKGFRFSLDSSGGTTQESNMFSDGSSWSVTSFFWGFHHKMDQIISQTVPLKMTRFYTGSNSVIPEWYGSQWNFFYNGANHFVSTDNFQLTDTDWHKYLMEFQRGNNTNDGVIRMWVDDVLVYEDAAVDWGDTGTTFFYSLFPMIQGNMSGSYSGGAMHTFWDNFVISSTKAEADTFLGGASPVNGLCGDETAQVDTRSYECSQGTSTNHVDGATTTTWDCVGSGGGTTDNCSAMFSTSGGAQGNFNQAGTGQFNQPGIGAFNQ